MKRSEEAYLDLSERGFLATVGPRGRPTIVPVCFAYSNGVIYTAVDAKPKTTKKLARLRNIRHSSSVAFIADNYSQNWEALSYLLIHGTARIVNDRNEIEMARALLMERYPQYRWLRLKPSAVIAVSVERTSFWAFGRGGRQRHMS